MIKGENLLLRALEPTDVELLYKWENDMTLWPVSNTLVPFSRYQLEKYIKTASLDLYQTRQLRLVIELTDNKDQVSTAGMLDLFDYDPFHSRAGLGIIINESYRGQGIAKDAIKLFLNYAFTTLGIHNIYCNVAQSNDASLNLFKSLGFSLVGIKKEWLKIRNGYEDELMFQIVRP